MPLQPLTVSCFSDLDSGMRLSLASLAALGSAYKTALHMLWLKQRGPTQIN
jgi:hypothetical protein